MNLCDCIPWMEHFLDSFEQYHKNTSKGVPIYDGQFLKNKGNKHHKKRTDLREHQQEKSKRSRQAAQKDHRPPDTTERLATKSSSAQGHPSGGLASNEIRKPPSAQTCTSEALLATISSTLSPAVKTLLKKYKVAAVQTPYI